MEMEGMFKATYVDSPELFDRVERDNFLQQIIPVIALQFTWGG